jgi:hypothetical protein
MGYECINDCQIELSPGLFKFIKAGQTEFEKDVPIDYVKPSSRRHFRLTGDDVKKDLQDKAKIRRALEVRKCRFKSNASTADLADVLAKDNARRGITDLESLEIVSSTSHFADSRVIKAKARIDELYGLSEKSRNRPYSDDDDIDTLQKIIDDKEFAIIGETSNSDDEKATIHARLKELGKPAHHSCGLARLKELLTEAEADV